MQTTLAKLKPGSLFTFSSTLFIKSAPVALEEEQTVISLETGQVGTIHKDSIVTQVDKCEITYEITSCFRRKD